MGLLAKINAEMRSTREEKRTIGGAPWAPWLSAGFGGRDSFAIGGLVHPSRGVLGEEAVLGLHSVYSCIDYIASSLTRCKIKVYRQLPDGTAQRVPNSGLLGSDIAGGGPQPPGGGSLRDWVYQGSYSVLAHGTAWGLVTNRSKIPGIDGLGLPTGIAWLPAGRVSVTDDEMQPENPARARVYYNGRLMDRGDLVMMRGLTVPGQLAGMSPMRLFMTLHQQGLDALKYSADWFQNGGFPPGTFQNMYEQIDDEQAREIRRRLTDSVRLRQPLVYGSDWEYKPLDVPPDEAIFIKGMQLNAAQIASIYHVPAWRVGGLVSDSMTYKNQASDMQDFITNGLGPWIACWESLLTSMLPASQYARLDPAPLQMMDPQTRSQVNSSQRNTGERTVNELRAEDDLGPLEGGDDPIPLSVLEKMLARTALIPNSYDKLTTPESDATVAQLEDLQAKGLVADSGKPPVGMTAQQYLGQQLISGRALQPSQLSPAHEQLIGVTIAQQQVIRELSRKLDGLLDELEAKTNGR